MKMYLRTYCAVKGTYTITEKKKIFSPYQHSGSRLSAPNGYVE
jgi:hypothetical protein